MNFERMVKLNTAHAPKRYVQKQHGCTGFVERAESGNTGGINDRFTVRVLMADGCTGWFVLQRHMFKFL